MAELVPVYTRRERRFRNLGKVLFVIAVLLVSVFILSLKVTIIDNDIQWKWVEFENNQGEELAGLVIMPRETQGLVAPGVIVTHDLSGHKEQLNRLSLELARHGFIVLAVDMRDHGRSKGECTHGDYETGESWDLVAAYDYLTTEVDHVDVTNIGIVGDGFGGAMALMATNHLLEQNKTVQATVAWGPPIDVEYLKSNNWGEVERWVNMRIGDVDWEYSEDQYNRSAINFLDATGWNASRVSLIYGQVDEIVPRDSLVDMSARSEPYEVIGLGHDLSESDEVLSYTIDTLYIKLGKEEKLDKDFNYQEVELLNAILHALTLAVFAVAFLMLYEVAVMKKTARSYIPEFDKDAKPLYVGVAALLDITIYVGIAWAMSGIYSRLDEGLFWGILPGSAFFTTVLTAGAFTLLFGIAIWYAWSNWIPKDEDRSEETCGNLKGMVLAFVALIVIVLNFIFGQVLLFGANLYTGYSFLMVTGICFLFFLGHELWIRKLVHPKINHLISKVFLRRRWLYQLSFFGAMYGIYALMSLVMLSNVAGEAFGPEFGKVYGLMVTGIGFVATLIYHRSKSLLASTMYSSIMAPWLLNLAYHL